MDLFLIFDEDKSHYVYIKDFEKLMFRKTKNKNKKYFCKNCLQCFSSKNVFNNHIEVCLSINDAQSVRLEKGTIELRNFFKQEVVPFKLYPDFECILNSAESYEGSCSKKYQDHIPCSFAYKLFVLIIDLVNQLLFTEVRMLFIKLLEQFFKSMNTVKK